jgi:hypothetical protein
MRVILLILALFSFHEVRAQDNLNQVSLTCNGTIRKASADGRSEIVASASNKEINVINPWFGEFFERRDLKDPQVVVRTNELVGTVKKGINSAKEIILEVYQLDNAVISTNRGILGVSQLFSSTPYERAGETLDKSYYERIAFSPTELSKKSAMGLTLGNYQIRIECADRQTQ